MVVTTRIDGGGVGKLAGRAALAGTAGIDGGVVSNFHGHGSGLRRSPGDASVHENEGKRARVSAVRVENKVPGSERETGQPNGVAMVASYLGHGEVDAAASTPSWRC
jgi:hypothetical protein